MDELQELNVQVAESLGHQRVSQNEPYIWPTKEQVEKLRDKYPDLMAVDYYIVPPYSTDIAAAWGLVEWMGDVWFPLAHFCKEGHQWRAQFGLENEAVEAPTAPEAICRAFLAAKSTP